MPVASGELGTRIGGLSVDVMFPAAPLCQTPAALCPLAISDTADGLTSTAQRNATTTPTRPRSSTANTRSIAQKIRRPDKKTTEGAPRTLAPAFRTAWDAP